MSFHLTILGCNSAIPTASRYPTAQLLNIQEQYFLIDCGEGTQIQLRKNRLKFQRISHIFISHLHGDHFFGLIGLLNTMQLLGRKKELHLHAPHGLKEIIDVQLKHSGANFEYELHFHPTSDEKFTLITETEKVEISSFPLNHRIPTTGFLFREKEKPRTIIKEMLGKYRIAVAAIPTIKEGGDYVTESGETITNEKITMPPPPPRSYAFCSDTKYDESIVPYIQNVDLLYHEATFLDEFKERAADRYHSTTKEAATIAKMANANQLIIGHYSARYSNLEPLKLEAQEIFPNTELALEGNVYEVLEKK